jgi:hypothetical protein
MIQFAQELPSHNDARGVVPMTDEEVLVSTNMKNRSGLVAGATNENVAKSKKHR